MKKDYRSQCPLCEMLHHRSHLQPCMPHRSERRHRSPDSVPNQYTLSGTSRSMMYLSLPKFCRDTVRSDFMMFCASLGASVGDFTRHSKVVLRFVTLMCRLRHHPLILEPLMFSFPSLWKDRSWWKPCCCKVCVQVLSLVFHTT